LSDVFGCDEVLGPGEGHDAEPACDERVGAGGHDGPGYVGGFEVVEEGAGAGDLGCVAAVVEGNAAFGFTDV